MAASCELASFITTPMTKGTACSRDSGSLARKTDLLSATQRETARLSIQFYQFRLTVDATIAVSSRHRKNRKTKFLQISAKFCDGFKEHPKDSRGAGSLNVFLAVIDEEHFRRRPFQQRKRMPVDDRVGFDGTHLARKNLVIDVAQPGEVVPHMGGHIRLHIGKNSGSKAARVDAREPFRHFLIHVAPHLHIQPAEVFNLVGMNRDAGPARKLDPISMRGEVAAIVWIARGTVDGKKIVYADAGDARHARESFGRRAEAEDFAVVEDDGTNHLRRSETRILFINHGNTPVNIVTETK